MPFTWPGWWRKHGITTSATVVEVGMPESPANPDLGGVNQDLVLDVEDPEAGVVRAKGRLWLDAPLHAGERIRIRWSSKHRIFDAYGSSTVPKDEWLRDHNQRPPRPHPQASHEHSHEHHGGGSSNLLIRLTRDQARFLGDYVASIDEAVSVDVYNAGGGNFEIVVFDATGKRIQHKTMGRGDPVAP